MRLPLVLMVLGLVTAASTLSAGASPTQAGFGSPACLRGEWGATEAETKRVIRALARVPGLEPRGKLYMTFRDGVFQYGSTSLVFKMNIGDAVATARARFFTLQRYTARPGAFTTQGGESTIEYGEMTATKDGVTYSVPGPPTRSTRAPGGTTPFQCRGGVLKVKLPRFASLSWITLHRA